jgi:hypothetical protein
MCFAGIDSSDLGGGRRFQVQPSTELNLFDSAFRQDGGARDWNLGWERHSRWRGVA